MDHRTVRLGKTVAAAVTLFASVIATNAARAGLITTSIGPSATISAGGTAALTLDIGFTPTSGYNDSVPYHCYNGGWTCSSLTDYANPSYLTALSVTVNSGAGQSMTFTGLGLFTLNFTYAHPGTFDVTVSGHSSESQFRDYSYFERDYYTYRCGFFSTCTGYDDHENGPGDYTTPVSSSVEPSDARIIVDPIAAAVPEPGSLALFGTGLLGFAFLAWKRTGARAAAERLIR